MSSPRLLIAGAAARGVRVARSLYSRWRALPEPERGRIADYAEDAKDKALALRGTAAAGRPAAEEELRSANETLAAALVETAEADPEIAPEEVQALRDDLRRELERLANGEVKASRGPGQEGPLDPAAHIKASQTPRGSSTSPG
jgi:hypothetical protein